MTPNLFNEPCLNKHGPFILLYIVSILIRWLIKPFLIVLIVMLTYCSYDSSVINLTYSEELQFLRNAFFVVMLQNDLQE